MFDVAHLANSSDAPDGRVYDVPDGRFGWSLVTTHAAGSLIAYTLRTRKCAQMNDNEGVTMKVSSDFS